MFGLGRHNVAVVGTGYMASKMAAVLNASPTVRPYAVVSRDLDRALSFGRENGFKKAYDSVEAMLADSKVEMVYIATPASEHAAQVRLCIEAGKPILCETPIALTAAEAESLMSLSESLDVLVVEAVHIRFLPFFKQIVSVISSGAIGTPVMLTANMASDMENLPRLQRPSLGGGALGDMGYFLLNFSSMIFGDKVKRIQSSCTFTPVRVDRQLSIVLQYIDDRMAVLSCTTSGNGESRAVIQGTKGYMVIEDLKNFSSATVYDTRRAKTATYKRGKYKSEFEFEMAAFAAAMKSGWKECPEIPHSQSLSMMQMMDFIRRQLGISYEEIQISQIPDVIMSSPGPQISSAGETVDTAAAETESREDPAGSRPEEMAGPGKEEEPAEEFTEAEESAEELTERSAEEESEAEGTSEEGFTEELTEEPAEEENAEV
ncbi:MAG: Gfo/Idh/MocA family oxidoreductase [Lachnospiraceae bacterium]|nr:Gfo/Idh/MocA family oxidoreductase [Lachnospiraceae bacterium]